MSGPGGIVSPGQRLMQVDDGAVAADVVELQDAGEVRHGEVRNDQLIGREVSAVLRESDGDVDKAVASVVKTHVGLAAGEGFVTNLGGLTTAPATIPANIAGLALLQCRMVATIAQLRGYDSSEDAVFKVGPYLFRPSAKQLHDPLRNKRIRLTEKEAAILKFLYRAGGRPVPRNVLLNDVWGYNSNVTTHTLETHIYRLRQKIEPNPAETRILLTEAGGYRLEQTSEAEAG